MDENSFQLLQGDGVLLWAARWIDIKSGVAHITTVERMKSSCCLMQYPFTICCPPFFLLPINFAPIFQ